MSFHLFESNGVHAPRMIADYPTFDDAWDALNLRDDVVFAEIDGDNPDCADAFTMSGMILCIEPTSRRTHFTRPNAV